MGKQANRRIRVHISFFILLAFLIYAVVAFTRQQVIIAKQEVREQSLNKEKTRLTSTLEELTNKLEHVGSDDYIEQEARKRLGWVKEGEIKFIDME